MLLWDHALFFAINHLPHTPFSDTAAMILSGVGTWGVVWFAIALWVFFREEKRDHWFFAPFFISAGASAFLSDWLLKMLVARQRPSLDMGAIIVSPTDNYSFPSTHTTLAFAMAYVLAKEEPRFTFVFYMLAVFIAASRIYLGVHFPVDIAAGMVLGLIIGKTSIMVDWHIRKNFSKKPRR